MKIFWSWQSDTPGTTGRYLIRDALKDAIKQLKQAPEIEEALRKEILLDSDIQNTLGSPDIARTIFRKIDESDVVVADVTIVGEVFGNQNESKSERSKKLINSNVAIELGYAFGARGDENVLLVFNKHYGSYEELPFDLRHKGGAVVFDLQPDAGKAEIADEHENLKNAFVRRLRPFLKEKPQPKVALPERPTTFNRAAYFPNGEPLTPPPDALAYRTPRLAYLRLMPNAMLSTPLELAKLKEVSAVAAYVPILQRDDFKIQRSRPNQYGLITYGESDSQLTSSTQLFQSGEVWCVSASLIHTERETVGKWVTLPNLGEFHLEEVYYDTTHKIVSFAKDRLGLRPPLDLELGLGNVEGVYLTISNGELGPIHQHEIFHRGVLNDFNDESINEVLVAFFRNVFDSVAERRPPNLHGFPPNRPRP